MCEICKKYRCPDGCPNNYQPIGIKNRTGYVRRRIYRVSTVIRPDGKEFRSVIKNIFLSSKR